MHAQKIRIVIDPAYSGGKINQRDFEFPVVMDLATLTVSPNAAILYAHDLSRRIGEITQVDNDGKRLTLSGVLYTALPDAQSIIGVSKAGGSWEASVGTEQIPIADTQDFTAGIFDVNGQSVEGPFTLCKNCIVREVSIISVGADSATGVYITAKAEIISPEKEQKMEEELKKEEEIQEVKAEDAVDAPVLEEGLIAFINDLGLKIEELTADQLAALTAKYEATKAAVEAEAAVEEEAPKPIAAGASLNRPIGGYINEGRIIEAGLFRQAGGSDESLRKFYGNQIADAVDSAKYSGVGLHALMKKTIQAAGETVSFMESPRSITNRFFRCIKAGISTRDWSATGLLSSIQNRLLQQRYAAYEGVARKLCRTRSVKDFKLLETGRLSLVGKVKSLLPGEDFPVAKVGENSQTYKVCKQGLDVILSYEDFVNDDLGVLDGVAIELADAMNQAQEQAFFTQFIGQISNLYKAANVNVGTAALGIAGVSTLNATFRKLKIDGRLAGYRPAMLLVPVALEGTALDIYKNNVTATSAGTGNPWQGRFEVMASEFLDDNSTTAWYLLPDTGIAPLGEIAYIDGNEAPRVDQYEIKDNMTFCLKCVGSFGSCVYNTPVGVRSTGAGA